MGLDFVLRDPCCHLGAFLDPSEPNSLIPPVASQAVADFLHIGTSSGSLFTARELEDMLKSVKSLSMKSQESMQETFWSYIIE